MNKGVEILLERMKSNPEEFLPEIPMGGLPPKWRDVVVAVHHRVTGEIGEYPYFDLKFLSDEDVKALHTKLTEIRGDQFTRDVLAKLLTDDSSQEASRHSFGGGASYAFQHNQMRNTLKIGKTELTESKMDLLETIIKQQEAKMKAELQKRYMEKYADNNP